jgi:hypothetical protein
MKEDSMSSNRIQRNNQVIFICDMREFAATCTIISGKYPRRNIKKINKFYSFMDFYLKALFEMLTDVLEFINGRPLTKKKDITSKLLFNSTGDGALLVIGGMPPENVISTYIYSFYLDCLLRRFCKKLEKQFRLPKLKRRFGIALAFGDATAIQYRFQLHNQEKGDTSFFNVSSLISEKINTCSRVESSNKDHINADISLDSSFVDELYRFMFPKKKSPKQMMMNFKRLKTKQERLEMLNQLNANDIDLLIDYLGHHYFKGGGTVVHIVSPVLVSIKPDLKNNVVIESEELKVFYLSVNERIQKDLYNNLIYPLQRKLLALAKELDEL